MCSSRFGPRRRFHVVRPTSDGLVGALSDEREIVDGQLLFSDLAQVIDAVRQEHLGALVGFAVVGHHVKHVEQTADTARVDHIVALVVLGNVATAHVDHSQSVEINLAARIEANAKSPATLARRD